ncbi:unnamed protein product [Mytilus coruscus]|uniref:Uncharacterized protein n=1 Tax=Mytilus coruscus TaxID=42192 RepID=A0A6J8EE60_MYTCO|nr:unnamed protein product [Mytilus coruscus]
MQVNMIYDDLETVSVLYNAGAYLDLTDCTGKTALLLALQDGNDEICSFLIRNGTDVNVVDYIGQSALYTVVHSHEKLPLSLCKKLVDAGYNFEHDTEWISKDLHRQLTQPQVGLVSRIKRRLSFKRNPERQHEDNSTVVSNDKDEARRQHEDSSTVVSNDKKEARRQHVDTSTVVSNDKEEARRQHEERSIVVSNDEDEARRQHKDSNTVVSNDKKEARRQHEDSISTVVSNDKEEARRQNEDSISTVVSNDKEEVKLTSE